MKIYFPAQKFMEDVFLSIKKVHEFENPPVKRQVYLDKNVVHLVDWRASDWSLNYEPENAFGFMYYFIDNDGKEVEKDVIEIREQLAIRAELARREYEVLHHYFDMHLEIEPRGKYNLVKISYSLPARSRIVASADEVSDDSKFIKNLLLEAIIGEKLDFSVLAIPDEDDFNELPDVYDDEDEERYSSRDDD
jgi:hypothetical protein